MYALIDASRRQGIKIRNGEILMDNSIMRTWVEKIGFSIHCNPNHLSVVLTRLEL